MSSRPERSSPAQSRDSPNVHADVRRQRERDVWILAIGIRLICAFTIATFFQPDEYYQSLEPAWQLVFGRDSGAWLTWVRCTASDYTVDMRLSLHVDHILRYL